MEHAGTLVPIEIKSGETITERFFSGLKKWKSLAQSEEKGILYYGGLESQMRSEYDVRSWTSLAHVSSLPV